MTLNKFTVTRVFLSVLCMALLLTGMTACKEQPTSATQTETETETVIRPYLYRYGRYVYESGNRMKRYDLINHTLTPACIAPDCAGDCPLDNAITEANGLCDGRLYFYSFEAFTHRVLLGFQDLVSGEVKVLVELSEAEQGSTRIYVHEGYMYYQCKLLRDGGDPSNPTDYEASISRVPVDGGKSEAACKPDGKTLLMGADGKLLLQQESVLFTYDLASGETRELYDLEKNGFKFIKSGIFLAGGQLYFLASTGASDSDAAIGFTHTLAYLVSIDMDTGEGGKLMEAPVEFFDVTETGIYYIPYRLRILYLPENYAEDDDPDKLNKVLLSTQDEHLWACGFGGENPRKVAEKAHADVVNLATVLDGELYGMLQIYDIDAHTKEVLYATFNLESGEVIRVKKEENS